MKQITFYPKRRNKLAFLSRPIEEMFGIMDHYVDDQKESGGTDFPYHYNERATLSIFAGALWRSDDANLVLEEFGTEKKGAAGDYKGRQDIWFRASSHSCIGEAKQKWVRLNRVREDITQLLGALEQELHAAQKAIPTVPAPERPELAVGILFVTPWILQAHIDAAADNLSKLHQSLAANLEIWSQRTKSHVLWASYTREELLQERGCYEWGDGRIGSCPSLDTLICTQ
jgi:hypothetical protein